MGKRDMDCKQGLLWKKANPKQRLQMLNALPQKQRRDILHINRQSPDGNRQ